MTSTLFLTGATGYVGGALLHALVQHFPQWSIKTLVRTPEQGKLLTETYSCVTPVIGTLESYDLIVSESSKADVVLLAANVDHEAGTNALLDGAKKHPQAVFIVLSGSASLLDLSNLNPGKPAPRRYSDVSDAEEIWNLPRDRLHVSIERRIALESDAAGIRTIILAPSQIFHTGVGVGRKDSYLHYHPRAIMDHGKPFVIDEGNNIWAWIEIEDLASAVVFLITEALKPDTQLGFGRHGYYFCQAGELSALEQAEVLAQELKTMGAIEDTQIEHITPEEALKIDPFGVMLWGTSMRSRAERLKVLGWEPKVTDWRPLVKLAARQEVEARRAKAKEGGK